MDHAASLPKRKRKKKRKKKLPRSGYKFLPRSRRLFGTNSTLSLREGGPWFLRSILAASCPHGSLQAQDARHLGRYGSEGHLCRGTEFASVARAVRTWKPGLCTSHWYLAVTCLVLVLSEEHRKLWSFLGDAYAELFLRPLVSGSHLCGVFYDPTVSCSEFAIGVQEYGLFRKTNSGMVSVFITPWFDSGYMLGVSLRGLLASTLQKTADSPQLQFIEGSRHPCLYAGAVPFGPDCPENHRDSTVARRHDGRCPFRAGCTGSHVQVVGGTVVLPQFLLVEKIAVSYEDDDILIVMQRPILMVQRWTIEISQFQFVLGGRRPCFQDEQVHFPVEAQRQVHGPNCSFDRGHSTVAQHGVRCPCCAVLQFSSADVEETVELPRLHSLWISSCGAAHHRVDELMG